MLRSLALLLVLAVSHASAADARSSSEPRSYAQLQRALQGQSSSAREKRLRAFARDRRPALGDRLKAAAALRQLLDKDDPALVTAWLLEAHLQGVAGVHSLRKKALERARSAAVARKQKARAQHIESAIAGERALLRLEEAILQRERAGEERPLTSSQEKLAGEVQEALAAWRGLKDARFVGIARLSLARLDATTPGGAERAAKELAGLVRIGGNDRDVASVRAEVRRARARLLERAGDLENAVHEMLVADRAAVFPSTLPRFEAPPRTPYLRTRETAELCFRAHSRGVSCAKIEERNFDARSYYDFSREAPSQVFDEERAQMAALEFTPLLVDCIQEGVKDGSTRATTVQLEWAVSHGGKIKSYDLYPRRLRKTPFDACLKRAFALWRYPPYRGEMKHMGNSFTVGE